MIFQTKEVNSHTVTNLQILPKNSILLFILRKSKETAEEKQTADLCGM